MDASECISRVCADDVCCDRACEAANEFCALPGLEGTCIAVALPTATVTSTPTPNPTPQANGTPCLFDVECLSGFCTDGVCCAQRCDGANEVCAVPGFEGQCIGVAAVPDVHADADLYGYTNVDADPTTDRQSDVCRMHRKL